MTDTDIKIEIKAVSAQASKEINKLTKDIEKLNKKIKEGGRASNAQVGQMTRSFKSLTAHVSKLALIYGSFHTLLTSTVITAKFEESIKKLGVYSGATQIELAKLEEEAKRLGESTVFSASQVADGMNQMALAGLSSSDMLAGMEDILALASVGMISIKDSADYAITSMKAFGLEAKDINDITDIFAKGATISATNVTQLGQALTKVGGVAHSGNVSLEETVALLGQLADGGRRGAEAGTQLKIAMLRLSANPEAKKYLDKLNISMYDMVKNSEGVEEKVLVPFVEQLRRLRDGLKDLDAESKKQALARIIGTEAVASAIILMDNLDKVHDKIKKIRQAMKDDFALKSAKLIVDTLVGSFKNLTSSLEGLAIKIVSEMTPALREMLDGWTETIRGMDEAKIEDFSEMLIVLINGIVSFTGAVASTVSVLTTFQKNNENLVRVLAEVLIGLKLFSVTGLGNLIATTGSASAGVTLLRANLKGLIVQFATFAKANPLLFALIGVTVATYAYIDSIEKARKELHEFTKDAIKNGATYHSVVKEIVSATDYLTGTIGENDAQRAKLATTIATEITNLEKELATMKKGGQSSKEFADRKKAIREQIEQLDQKLIQIGQSWGKYKEGVEKSTKADIENILITQQAIENYEKFDKALNKRVVATEKSLAKMIKAEQKFNINLQKLQLERAKIVSKYSDMRLQVIEDYNRLEFDATTKSLDNYKKYTAEKQRADELLAKGARALSLGNLQEASRYYGEAKSLATGFAGTVIEVNGKVLADSKSTWGSASKIYNKTKQAELYILKQKEIKELEANASKMELIALELEGQKTLVNVMREQLKALTDLGKKAGETKAQFDKVDYLEKFNKDMDASIKKYKENAIVIRSEIDKKKFELQKSQLDNSILDINSKKISPKVDTSEIEGAEYKVASFNKEFQKIDGEIVEVFVVVDNDGNVLKATKNVNTLQSDLNRLTIGDYIVDVDANTTPADFNISHFVSRWDGKEIKQVVNPEWKMAQKILKKFRNTESKKEIHNDLRANTKPAMGDVNEFDNHVKRLKPTTQPVYSDVSNVVEVVDLTVNWINSQNPYLFITADVNNVYAPVIDAINWINSQVAYIDVYTRYHNSGGGYIPKLAEGGFFSGSGRVGGYDPTDSDKVSAMLTGGEYVVKREAVDMYGMSLLESINRMSYAKNMKFSEGGSVGNNGNATSALRPININFGDKSFQLMSDTQVGEALERYLTRTGGR